MQRTRTVKPRTEEQDAVPQIAATSFIPSDEDFYDWTRSRVTQFVALALLKQSERLKEEWMNMSWEGGKADQEKLIRLKALAEQSIAFLETKKEEYERTINE